MHDVQANVQFYIITVGRQKYDTGPTHSMYVSGLKSFSSSVQIFAERNQFSFQSD